MKILNHDAYDPKRNSWLGQTSQGTDVYLDKIYLEAEKRIVMGFVEPHFFAGFSGGAKGIAPGVASIETILHLHRAELIADPMSTWGVLDENPIQREIAEAVALCPPDFLVNVTLNSDQAITEFYLGDYREAHRQGCASVKELSMVAVDERFPLIITSNSGFPLDQNLYQTAKGMSAAERIVETGGTILVTSECRDGLPDHGNFSKIMQKGSSPEDVLKWISALDQPILDQWQAQILAGILQRANVAVYSRVKETELRGCKLSVIKDLQKTLQEKIQELGNGGRVAVFAQRSFGLSPISRRTPITIRNKRYFHKYSGPSVWQNLLSQGSVLRVPSCPPNRAWPEWRQAIPYLSCSISGLQKKQAHPECRKTIGRASPILAKPPRK